MIFTDPLTSEAGDTVPQWDHDPDAAHLPTDSYDFKQK